MQRLVTLLPETVSQNVKAICADLKSWTGLTEIRTTTVPHFSWVTGENFLSEPLHASLREFTATIDPFSVYATGLGIFPGNSPVLYIPIVKTAQLHLYSPAGLAAFPNLSETSSTRSSNLTSGRLISALVFDELSGDSLGKILRKIAFKEINFKFAVDNISLLVINEEETVKLKFSFKPDSNQNENPHH